MVDYSVRNLDYSDVTNALADYSVSTLSTDGVYDQFETTWTNVDFTQWYGYYNTVPELKAAIDAKATWTVGKGYIANKQTTFICERVTGWGKDTFNEILKNLIKTYLIGGDAFAEIIRDREGNFINIKPLDPSTMMIVAGRNGRIKRYEQLTKVKGGTNKKFKPEQIFHLARNRVADQIHGISLVKALETLILARNEAIADWKRVLHRNVDPMWIFHLDTDDTTTIASIKAKMDAARGAGENMYIPKGAVVPEAVTTAGNASLNPLPWIEALNNYFFQACGVPGIIIGYSQALTEASAKIAYLAFQQSVEEEQLFLEENIAFQLGLEIELEFPISLQNEALSEKPKVKQPQIQQNEQAIEPNDMQAEMEGRK